MGQSTQPDKVWFQRKFADAGMSQRRLAALMELNHAAVSLALQGERKLTLDEAATLARLLGEPFEEIVRRMGIAVPAPRGAVLLNHTIDRTGRIIKQQPSGPRTIPHHDVGWL